jgi:hypothetical protein
MEWKISETNIGRKSHAKTQRRKGKSEYEAVPRGLIIVLVLVEDKTTRTITIAKLYRTALGLVGIGSSDAYVVGSGIPATINASLRSTQVPHVPQCRVPPL